MKIFFFFFLVGRTFLANQTVTVEDGQITAIGGGGPADFSVWALTPGLVDLHCHGGQGFDPELNERPLPEFLTILLCHGVTDVLLTLGAEPLPTMRRALAVVQTAMQQQAAGKLPGAHILGVHLEGPFLSPERPGAMPPAALLPPTLAAYQTLVQGYESVIRQVTLAPELPGALELGAALAARGIRVQAGHTDADYETAQRAFSAGFTGLCHTFNACRPLRHRDPGVVAAALLDPNVTTECICDLVHLHPAALQLVYHMKGPEAMIAVSDYPWSARWTLHRGRARLYCAKRCEPLRKRHPGRWRCLSGRCSAQFAEHWDPRTGRLPDGIYHPRRPARPAPHHPPRPPRRAGGMERRMAGGEGMAR